MKNIQTFEQFVNDKRWLIESQRDTPVDHIEDIEPEDDSDVKTEEELTDYVNKHIDKCPRCGEHISDCICVTEDPWSTQNIHRVPKGKLEISKPKQNFKK